MSGFRKEDLDLVLVPCGLFVMFAYHIFLLHRYLRYPETTVQGCENHDRKVFVQGLIEVKLEDRNFACNVVATNISAANTLCSISLVMCSLIGAWLASSSSSDTVFHRFAISVGENPSTTTMNYMAVLAFFLLAFSMFLQSARNFIHGNYLICAKLDSASMNNAIPILRRGGEFWTLGFRSLYFALNLVMWFFGPIPMFVSSVILVVTLYHHDFHSIPLGRARPARNYQSKSGAESQTSTTKLNETSEKTSDSS